MNTDTERHGAMSIQDEDLSAPGACQGATPKSAAGGDRFSDRGWPISEAPKDGTTIRGLYADGTEDDVQWEEYRCCMLGARAGSYGPGWQSTEQKLPVDEPTHWTPLPPQPHDPPAACESSRAEPLLSENTSLRGRVEGLETALRLILPMAKGYASAHPVGSNQDYIIAADEALAQGPDHG